METGTSDKAGELETLKVLPAQILGESYSASEAVTMTTIDQEQYTCVLPDLSGEATTKVSHFSVLILLSLAYYSSNITNSSRP